MNLKAIDKNINQFENVLSECAAVPVLGIIPGAVKAGFGCIQTVSAVALAIFSGFYGLYTKDMSLFKFSCAHIQHGLGNILAGVLEGIPLSGTGLYFLRQLSNGITTIEAMDGCADSGHRNKFMPYDSLVREDLKIMLSDTHIDELATTLFRNKVQDPKNQYRNIDALVIEARDEARRIKGWDPYPKSCTFIIR